ncbi:MAG: TolC family protein [Bryobacteraceae bacterium]
MPILSLFLLCLTAGVSARAEVRSMTLAEALDLARRQNPDLTLARLEEQRAAQGIRVARAPFTPRVVVGSGLAYSNGFPLSMEGAAPALLRAEGIQSLFNRPQSLQVARARENARGAAFAAATRQDEVLYQTADLFLAAERHARAAEFAKRQEESQRRVGEIVRERVQAGRELPIEGRQAALEAARAAQRAQSLEAEQAMAESSLALILGFGPGDRVRPIADERTPPQLPLTEEEAAAQALEVNPELRRLESALAANALEVRSYNAERLPRVDLVAQYALLSRFNNYEEFFQRFQRNNAQIGASIQIPIVTGSAISAQKAQALTEASRLRTQRDALRDRIAVDVRQDYMQLRQARTAVEVARLELEVIRDRISVLLAQQQEGRITMRQVEEARVAEAQRWIELYDAQYNLERVGMQVLRETGQLATALR